MNSRLTRLLVTALIAAVFITVPALAQTQDCTGISDVSDFDGATVGDFTNLLTTAQVATGLLAPVHMISPPEGTNGRDDRLFIVEQRGRIRILDLTTGSLLGGIFLDIQGIVNYGGEQGLLSLAFHPDYNNIGSANEGEFFVYFTNNSGNQQINRYKVSINPNIADSGSATTVITMTHPTFSNHNGGQIAFGPDGHLYAGVGDGGGGCDPGGGDGNGQSTSTLLGKMLRLRVDTLPYTTNGNPFDGGTPGLDEIWATGLRNPWRFSFDRLTGALYIGDVGQNQIEEIDCQKANSIGGENYGWVFFEANSCATCSGVTIADCQSIPHTKPLREYPQGSTPGFSITGGFVYRGCRMTDLHGSYFFADYSTSYIRTFRTDQNCTAAPDILRTSDLDTPSYTINSISSFGEDSRGEIYIADLGGQVYRVIPTLDIMQVSGPNAPQLRYDGNMTWEDLEVSTGHPISDYKVYRAIDDPAGIYLCTHQGPDAFWTGGDPDTPNEDEVFYYIVTALNNLGEESRPGKMSDGTARVVDTNSVCP